MKLNSTTSYGQMIELLHLLADFTIDGDIIDGEEHLSDGNDDEIEALYSFVHTARAIVGRADPSHAQTKQE